MKTLLQYELFNFTLIYRLSIYSPPPKYFSAKNKSLKLPSMFIGPQEVILNASENANNYPKIGL